MGIAYRVDTAIGLVVSVADGAVTAAEFDDFARRQGEDPAWHAATRSITDVRGAETLSAAAGQLEASATQYAELRAGDPPLMIAIVAGRDFDGASRYGDLRSQHGSRTIAFNSLETACTWLGIDAATTGATIAELRQELRASRPE
jgi:hypothetical protein